MSTGHFARSQAASAAADEATTSPTNDMMSILLARLDAPDTKFESVHRRLKSRSRGPSSPITETFTVPPPAAVHTAITKETAFKRLSDDATYHDHNAFNTVTRKFTTFSAYAPPPAKPRTPVNEHNNLAKMTAEFDYFLSQPFNPASSVWPSEAFVLALFPKLVTRQACPDRVTPNNMTNSKITLPKFYGTTDPDLHTKLLGVQTQLARNYINFSQWASFASDSCGSTHTSLRDGALHNDFRWHHFVLAVICQDGLEEYASRRDVAFCQCSWPLGTPNEVKVQELLDALEYAPLTHKTTAHRVMEFGELIPQESEANDAHWEKLI
ncbi:hypothetical protein SEPCBS57363_004354 [Sporothrix epigloea]|uniref:Uncharacterized protein n=1 Tax=Sporothrix epigloea TaxID=1892477 RepID=A0ABP0DVA6_9PEZI